MTRPPPRPTPEEVQSARGRTIRDVLQDRLDVLFCGINPGLYTAATGHHFARPGNRFWPALHDAGFTPRRLFPWEQHELITVGCGVTNLVARATATADELHDEELRAGFRRLERKVRRYRPAVVAIVGLGAYRVAFSRPRASLGLQPDTVAGARLWVLPNTSGLNAHHQAADFARAFKELRTFIRRQKKAARTKKHRRQAEARREKAQS
jgi:TDG/mug DNA glycosylase family protein